MERRKRSRGRTAASRIAADNPTALNNIAELIGNGGQISIDALPPIQCAAVANDEDSCLAMLRRKPGETLQQLFERLDAAIALAWTTGQFIDEINAPPDKTSR